MRATFADGGTGAFDALIGADGVHSAIRALALGKEAEFARSLGYYTAAFVLDSPPLRGLPPDAFSTLTEPGRQVAIYPIRGDRLATFFIHKADRALDDFSAEAARAALRRVYGDMNWVVPELLDRSREVAGLYFDVVEQITMPRWSQGRVALVGDACQCVSLLAGQGASMTMAGAYTLALECVFFSAATGLGQIRVSRGHGPGGARCRLPASALPLDRGQRQRVLRSGSVLTCFVYTYPARA
ncbi:MAG: FAD-dependent monooxygenase [Chloroflexi bacterium]|nr:FAD-dependent monooxygenase [Chloroflexota bacterium]